MSEFVKVRITDEVGKELQHYFVNAGEWGLPAGKIEVGETALNAAARELLERTGFQIDVAALTFVGTEISDDTNDTKNSFDIFTGSKKDLLQIAKPGEKGGYVTEVRWK